MAKITITSFGYRFGVPVENATIIDVRKIFNPFHVAGDKTGLNTEISAMVLSNGGMNKVKEIIEIGGDLCIGCIGGKINVFLITFLGRHRSVAVAEEVARRLRERGDEVIVIHRDINK